jgi:hypothetical protein
MLLLKKRIMGKRKSFGMKFSPGERHLIIQATGYQMKLSSQLGNALLLLNVRLQHLLVAVFAHSMLPFVNCLICTYASGL